MFKVLNSKKTKDSAGLFLFLWAFVSVAGLQSCAPGGFKTIPQKLNLSSNMDVLNVNVTEHPVEQKTLTTSFTLQLSERNYIAGILTDAFGPSGKVTIRNNVLLKQDDFGGPCSIYAHYMRKSGANFIDKDPAMVCDEENSTKQLIPPPNAVRQGWMIQTCSDLTGRDSNPPSLEYIFGKIQSGATLANPPEASDINLIQLHKLFYRERPLPPKAVLDAVKMFFSPGGATVENWKTTINSYCISSQWQVI